MKCVHVLGIRKELWSAKAYEKFPTNYQPETMSRSLDGVYVDGSVTLGNPRKHLWAILTILIFHKLTVHVLKHQDQILLHLFMITTTVSLIVLEVFSVDSRKLYKTHCGMEPVVYLKIVTAIPIATWHAMHGFIVNFLKQQNMQILK